MNFSYGIESEGIKNTDMRFYRLQKRLTRSWQLFELIFHRELEIILIESWLDVLPELNRVFKHEGNRDLSQTITFVRSDRVVDIPKLDLTYFTIFLFPCYLMNVILIS